ncbi:MAG: UDP-N-acetylmuramate--L-alanine ligase [Flavobacteriales bacterium]|nr:UDP-N-acetylmuramate--L-alanine ligase [Flavobacteriales bacterium]
MEFDKLNSIYFLGIGGIGMSALARYFKSLGKQVAGYDRTETRLTRLLAAEGMDIHYTDTVDSIPESYLDSAAKDQMLVVYTPALPETSEQLNHFQDAGYTILKRAEVLGRIADNGQSICVAGTHGKTTVTSMIAHIMKSAGVSSNTLLGGISTNYGTNHIQHENGDLVIAEADEYDRSFLFLHPNTAIVTSVDADHLDIYEDHSSMTESYIDYTNNVINGGIIILSEDVSNAIGERVNPYATALTYSIDGATDYFAHNVAVADGHYTFDVRTPNGEMSGVELEMGGRHNVENAVAAIATAENNGVSHDDIKYALGSYKGVKRRFEVVFHSPSITYIDDYAHHPNEVAAALNSVKELYPGKKMTVLFQPHLFTRTRDFAEDFGRSLSAADSLLLLDIYPAREEPLEGVTSELILTHVQSGEVALCTKENAIEMINFGNTGVLVTLGAGDIDQLVELIAKKLNSMAKTI